MRPSAAAVEGRPAPQTDIPFVEDVVPADRPFSDVGAKGGVDDPAKMLRGWTGAPDSGLVLETAVGRYLTSPSALLSVLADRRRAVAIVSAEGTDYRGDVGRWSGTGFVVAPNLFLTNHHVLNSDEGSLRRRLASRILARAVEDLSGETGHDVILGGDMNAPLASDDFKHIERAGFTILGAQDEREGAFTYLKSPRSAIDNVFLSPGMRQSVGSVDYFIVAKDRSMSDFVDRVSDHRPIAMRLSLGRTHGSALPEVGDLDALIEELLAQQKAKNTRKRITRRRAT
jgi:hypothetical protein